MAKIIGAGGRGTQPPQQPKLDMNNSKPMVCKHCGYDVFISGATGDIGTEISKKLAMLNCNLILCGSNEQKLKNLSASLNHKKNTINI